MAKFYVFLFIFFFPVALIAQYNLTGKVVDNADGLPLAGATVSNSNDSLLAITDARGVFTIETNVPQLLVIRYVGFEPTEVMANPGEGIIDIALIPDTQILQEVKIEAYESNRPIKEVAGSIGLIRKQDLQRFDETSLVTAMNQVPGVRMEQRSTGSYRISIRGSALRAPFDVRNVKVYWNNIPLTEPGGNTPFNLQDNSNIDQIEIIKGPASSLYGAGIGGVVNLKSEDAFKNENSISTSFSVGSFGLQRHTLGADFSDSQKAFTINYANQKSDGYRDHSSFQRKVFHLGSTFKNERVGEFRTDIVYTDLFYEIPGGLTKEEYDANPRQARPGNPFVLGSEQSNASISVKTLLAGITYDTRLSDRLELLTTLYANVADFVNPFNLDYKREAQQGYGGRSRINLHGRLANAETKLTVGGEYQFRFASARNYGNNMGLPDTLNFDDELRTRQYLGFAQYEIFFPANWILTAGLSINNVKYDIYRLVDSEGADGARVNKKFETQWMPRIGLVKSFGDIAMHGSISYGFSPPTLEEVRTNEGSINLDLEAEKGINYEIGFRGNTFSEKLTFDVSFFYLQLSETIVDYTSDRGTDLFRNAGSTDQKGVEAGLNYKLLNDPYATVSALNLRLNYAYHHFEFNDYVRNENDFSGNNVTGVAPHTFWLGIDLTTEAGIYGNLNYNFTDKIPLNDANEVFADSYQLVTAKLGFRKTISDSFIFDIYAGADNILDEKYSLGNDLNPFGGRYFQPAPERNYYAGLSLTYRY